MESKPIPDARAVTSPQNGKLGGRPKASVKYAPIVKATEKHLAEILKDDIPNALRDLVRGVLVQETTLDGEPRVYQRPPDLRAIEMVMNRIMGRVEGDGNAKAEASATIVNINRVNVPELHI